MLASRGAPWFPGKGGALQTIYAPTGGYTASSVSEFTHRLFPSPWRALEFTDAESVDTDLTGPWFVGESESAVWPHMRYVFRPH